MKNNVLISNFPTPSADKMLAVQYDGSKHVELYHCGFDCSYTRIEKNNKIIQNILIGLLVHDEIYLTFQDFNKLFDVFPAGDILALLESSLLNIIPDGNILPAIPNHEPRKFGTLRSIEDNQQFEFFERNVSENKTIPLKSKQNIIQYAENSIVPNNLSSEKVDTLLTKEISTDLQNENTKSILGLKSHSIEDLDPIDVYKILRIAHMCKSLLYQQFFNIASATIDGYCNDYLNAKSSLLNKQRNNYSIKSFTDVLSMKEIPDFSFLYQKSIVSVKDILEWRNNINGRLFREWYRKNDYDKQSLIAALLNSSKFNNSYVGLIRWVVPSVIGILSTVSGIITSAVDSLIIDKLISGWNPYMYLDKVLQRSIDEKIENYQRIEMREKLVKRYGSIGRNDLCPCQSGKKFKKCCGK